MTPSADLAAEPQTIVTDAPPSLLTERAKNLALALLAMTQFVVVIDASIVNVALPSIGRALKFSQDDLTWVVNAYTLTFGGFLLLGGRLADLMGRRRDVHGRARRVLARLARRRPRPVRGLADRARAPCRAWAPRSSPRPRCRSSRRPSPKAPSATARSACGARSPAPAAPRACCSAACSRAACRWRWVLFVNVPIGVVCALLAPRLLAGEPRRERDAQLRHPRRRDRHGRASRCSSTRSSTPSTPAGARPKRCC